MFPNKKIEIFSEIFVHFFLSRKMSFQFTFPNLENENKNLNFELGIGKLENILIENEEEQKELELGLGLGLELELGLELNELGLGLELNELGLELEPGEEQRETLPREKYDDLGLDLGLDSRGDGGHSIRYSRDQEIRNGQGICYDQELKIQKEQSLGYDPHNHHSQLKQQYSQFKQQYSQLKACKKLIQKSKMFLSRSIQHYTPFIDTLDRFNTHPTDSAFCGSQKSIEKSIQQAIQLYQLDSIDSNLLRSNSVENLRFENDIKRFDPFHGNRLTMHEKDRVLACPLSDNLCELGNLI
jgi:hypothetical protein